MYDIYKTEGLIMGGLDRSERNRLVYIFTKDFGFVMAHVQGVRDVKSKLRYALANFSHSHIDLVRGKSGWRVTNAHVQQNFFYFSDSDERMRVIDVMSKTAQLLRRLIHGEQKNEDLFNEMIQCYTFLTSQSLTHKRIALCEIVMVMRILNHLGYWGNDLTFKPFLEGAITENLLDETEKIKSHTVREINKALKETQL